MEIFAPVVRTETIRLLFSISAQENRKMRIYDVKTAFLHGKLKEEIFMKIPEGLRGNKEETCKLKRSIYGLKQAGKCWNDGLTEGLIKCGLKQSKEDPCLFYAKKKIRFLYCGVHVDDMATVSSDNEFEKGYKEKIKQFIDLKDLEEAETVLACK